MKKRPSINPWAWVPSLYFAEGIPNVIVTVVSLVMYKQMGLSNAAITFYTTWLNLPWLIKPLWSPFVDIIRTKRFWVVAMELFIGAALAGVAFTIPTHWWFQSTMFFFFLMAFSSATHDIAADGFYMLGLSQHDQSLFVGIRSTFYRFAMIFGQGVLVMVAGNLQVLFRNSIRLSWSLTFYGLTGLFIALWLWHRFILPHPREDHPRKGVTMNDVWHELGQTIVTFFTKPYIVTAILFMLFYRMPEGFLTKITPLFLIDSASNGGLGLSPQEYGFVSGTVGVIGLLLGGILGGMAVSRDGLRRWLWPMVCAITIPDIVYVYLSYSMTNNLMIVSACLFFEQFGYGFGFTAYMLYLIYFSQGDYKTSHYALCTFFMTASLMLPGLVSGWMQEQMGYRMYFVLVMAFCLVTYIVTKLVHIDPEFGKK
ncbi:MAG: MFS transporter [Prevotella sp.]|nr:MFS transporter [Prevotella sp.]